VGKKHIKNKTKSQTQEPLLEMDIEPGTSCTKSGWVTTAPPGQLGVSIVVKLFNCFDAMGPTVNKKAEFLGHTF